MKKLYLSGLDPLLAPIIEEFDRLCAKDDIKYQIVEDCPTKQALRICNPSAKVSPVISRIRLLAAPNTVAVKQESDVITIQLDRLAESRRESFRLGDIDDVGAYSDLQNYALEHLGERLRAPLAALFKGMSVPVRVKDVQTLWKSHENHPRWGELGDKRGVYEKMQGDFPPVVVDSVSESADYPAGRLRDGFRRLYRAHQRGDSLLETIDLKDVLSEARRLTECHIGDVGHLKKEILAHDQSTIIPKGTEVEIVDGDEGLPDLKVDGNIINVDMSALEKSFSEQIDRALEGQDHNPEAPKVENKSSDFETQINKALSGQISIVEPDILFTVTPTDITGNHDNA